GADRGVELLAAAGETQSARHRTEVEQLDAGQVVEIVDGLAQRPAAVARRRRKIVADDQFTVDVDPRDQLVELQAEQPAVGAQFDDVAVDLHRDPPDHLESLRHGDDVAHRDQIFDLEGRQGAGDLVEAQLVPLERGQGLVGPGENLPGIFEHVADVVDVDGDDAHRLADGDDRETGLLRDPLCGAAPGAGLGGGNRGVGHQLSGGGQNAGAVAVDDDRAVHLRQLAQPGGDEFDVVVEAAGAHLLDALVMAEDDLPSHTPGQNPPDVLRQ